MRRREFIAGLGGVAVCSSARAQQSALPVIGFLDPASPEASADRLRAFRQGLKETGYVEDENVAIEYLARGPASGAIEQVRVGHQRPNGEDARPRHSTTLLSRADEVIE